MIYAMILAVLLFVGSVARIVFLNSEIKTLDTTGKNLHARIDAWETENPIDYTTPESYAASKAKMPKDLQEAETEYEYFSNETDSKKESRTIWYGCALLSLVGFVIALTVQLGNSN